MARSDRLATGDRVGYAVAPALQRQRRGNGRLANARHGLHRGTDRGEIGVQFDRIGVLFLSDRQTCRQDIRRIESGIDVEQLEETAHQQSRTDQQHECERDFSDDENAAHAPTRAARRRAVSAFLQRADQARVRGLRGWHNAKQQARHDGNDQREQQDGRIHADVHRGRQRVRRNQRLDPFHHRVTDADSRDAAAHGDHDVLDQQLLYQARAARTERGAHRHLAFS